MVKLVIDSEERLCSQCPGGVTKMVQIPRTNTLICSVCSGFEWHYPSEELIEQQQQEDEIEYVIEEPKVKRQEYDE